MEAPNKVYFNHLTMAQEETPLIWMTRVLGWYYGYPPCCTQDRIEKIKNPNLRLETVKQEQASLSGGEYTGYIPCETCAEGILYQGHGPQVALRNRQCPVPFPKASPGNKPGDMGYGNYVQAVFDNDGYNQMYVKATDQEGLRFIHLEHTIQIENNTEDGTDTEPEQ